MFSIITTMFYMLSAYIAFIIGYSAELPIILGALVPLGFITGYLLDRFASFKVMWLEDRDSVYRLIIKKYFVFLPITAVFFGAGYLLAMR